MASEAVGMRGLALVNSGDWQVEEERERLRGREGLRRRFNRNQGIGLLLVAGAVLVYRLVHVPQGWWFPAGWWRFW